MKLTPNEKQAIFYAYNSLVINGKISTHLIDDAELAIKKRVLLSNLNHVLNVFVRYLSMKGCL